MSFAQPKATTTIFMGSPRKHSNTHVLAEEAGRALTERGVRVRYVYLDELTIRDCCGCHGCRNGTDAPCSLDDDMQGIYQMIRKSDGIIVAAPVYFGYVPAMTKAWLDRLVPFIGPGMRPVLPADKQVSFIFVQNMPDPGLFLPGLRSFMDSVAMTGLSVRDILVATDCEAGEKPMATDRPDLMERAYAIGRDLLV